MANQNSVSGEEKSKTTDLDGLNSKISKADFSSGVASFFSNDEFNERGLRNKK